MKKILYIIVIIFILLMGLWNVLDNVGIINNNKTLQKIKVYVYGEPIAKDGTINNEYFHIKSDATDARNTTRGINQAIDYASKNNIEYMKLQKGKYLIDGVGNIYEKKGIVLKSNLCLDLNNSIIINEVNSSARYTAITIFEVENVKVCNGQLIGDRYEHDYTQSNSTHEWGYGIDIRSSTNVEINNLKIEKYTGDGVLISSNIETERYINPYDVKITNCDISDCRRQGISIIGGENIDIYNNEIHDIYGTNPQVGIDIETDTDLQKIDKIKIHNNKLYSFRNSHAIAITKKSENIDIYDNIIESNIIITGNKEKVSIRDNQIKNGTIYAEISMQSIKTGEKIEEIEIKNNLLDNTIITIKNIEKFIFEDNIIKNKYIKVASTNSIIFNNNFQNDNEEKMDYACLYYKSDDNDGRYIVYTGKNIINNYYVSESIVQEEYISKVEIQTMI